MKGESRKNHYENQWPNGNYYEALLNDTSGVFDKHFKNIKKYLFESYVKKDTLRKNKNQNDLVDLWENCHDLFIAD